MSKRILVIDGHPDPRSERFVHALADAYVRGAERAGHHVRLLRLADLHIPMLRSAESWRAPPPDSVAAAQEAIRHADHLAIFYPLWLGDMPALFKAFLEQVMRPGFAIDQHANPLKAGRLKGRSARIVITMGMPALAYRLYFGAHSLRSLKRNVLGLVGIGPIADTLFGAVETSPQKRRRYLQRAEELGRKAA